MVINLFELNKNKQAKYISCEDVAKGRELRSYGFVPRVNVEVVSRTKHCVVVRVLDGLFSINKVLAGKIKVEVKD